MLSNAGLAHPMYFVATSTENRYNSTRLEER